MLIKFVIVNPTVEGRRQFALGHSVGPKETVSNGTELLVTVEREIGVIEGAEFLRHLLEGAVDDDVEGEYYDIDEDILDDLRYEALDLLGTLTDEDEDATAGKLLELIVEAQHALDGDDEDDSIVPTVAIIWGELE